MQTHIEAEPLSSDWKHIIQKYKPKDILGEGTFGKVILAKERTTKKLVAIKFIKSKLEDLISARNALREISILTQFSKMTDNIFTTKLLDIVIASKDQKTVKGAKGIFLVIEYQPNDLLKLT